MRTRRVRAIAHLKRKRYYSDLRIKAKDAGDCEDNILTPENVLACFDKDKDIVGQAPSFNTLMALSFYMDFAISTKDVELIDAIHNRIGSYVLEAYSRSYKSI